MDEPHPAGLKPTLRQLMIVVLWAALLTAGARAAIEWELLGTMPEVAWMVVPMYLGIYPMPLLAGLLWAFDRPGRVRDWYCSACMISASFLGGILYSLQDLLCHAVTGRVTMLFPMGPILALVGLSCGWMQWRQARPRRCPSCVRGSVIPIARVYTHRPKRMCNNGKHGWCASCGASCEREDKGEWGPSSPEP